MSLRRDNHFVPRSYLKRWADGEGKVWCYRLLVPHENVRAWKQRSLSGIAYQQHLYTTVQGGSVTDDLEHWLDREIEAPAEPVLNAIEKSRKLERREWMTLLRFTAAQDARTPARLVEDLRRWNRTMEGWVQATLERTISDLEKDPGRLNRAPRTAPDRDLPLKVTITKDEEKGGGWARVDMVVGRKMWVSSIRQRATSTWRHLSKHKWTIMTAPEGITWLTSDDPVIRLNYNSPTEFDFGGGYGSKGSEFIFPLSPTKLLYTQIGKNLPATSLVNEETARRIQEMILLHAHRWVFGTAPSHLAESVRPRRVDPAMFAAEAQEWVKWHAEQTAAELELGL